MNQANESTGIEAVLARHRAELHQVPGVLGVAQSRNQAGTDQIVVYVADASVVEQLPSTLEGYPISPIVSGQIEAYGID